MDITKEMAEFQKDDNQFPGMPLSDDQYRVLNYFKEHTGFFVACISAVVALMSFVIRFAIGRMNYAYLEYWNISTLYANADNQNEYYLIICTFLYTFVLMLIHAFLSKTSSTYGHYNKIQSTVRQHIKRANRIRKTLKKETKSCTKLIRKLEPDEKEDAIVKKAQEQIEKARTDDERMRNGIRKAKRSRSLVIVWIVANIGLALILSFIIGVFFALLLRTSMTMDVVIKDAKVILGSILLDVLLYFLPAYWTTRCTKKQYEELDIHKFVEAMDPEKMPVFPMKDAVKKGLTPIFSDSRIKQVVIKFLSVITLLLFFMPTIGTQSAKLQNTFPIYYEDSQVYAIVYVRGETVFMEEAKIQDGTIVIDTSSQRIVTTNDLSYERITFENVLVDRIDES